MKYQGTNPIDRLHPGEPYFFIRAQDRHAPSAIRAYALLLRAAGDHEGAREVENIARIAGEWQAGHEDLVKDPSRAKEART